MAQFMVCSLRFRAQGGMIIVRSGPTRQCSLALCQTQAGPKEREEIRRLSRTQRRAHYHDIDREGPSPGNSQVAPPRPGSANRASFASQACVVTHTSERFHASIPTMWAGDIDFVCSNARIWLDDVVNLRCCPQGTAG